MSPDTTTIDEGGRTAWARNLAAPVRDFLGNQTGSAAVLLGATVAALLWANSPWPGSYEDVWTTTLSLRLGHSAIALDLRHWVNQGLMTFFFLVVGLEAKREMDVGELRERRRLALPVVAAIGGAVVPVLIYLALNAGSSGAHGWGAAMSTDTAFALGVVALLIPRATRLRVFLLSLAVVDDLVALLVIATVYTDHVAMRPLAIAIGLFAVLFALRLAPVNWRMTLAAIVGAGFWIAVLESGIDPVIAGLAVGLVVSAYPPPRSQLERVTELTRSFREQPTPEAARTAQLGVASAVSPNERLQYRLHPWTSYAVVPIYGGPEDATDPLAWVRLAERAAGLDGVDDSSDVSEVPIIACTASTSSSFNFTIARETSRAHGRESIPSDRHAASSGERKFLTDSEAPTSTPSADCSRAMT